MTRIADALGAPPSGLDIAAFVVSVVATLATIFVGVAALVLATRTTRLEIVRDDRRRRVELAAAMKVEIDKQLVAMVNGTWDFGGSDASLKLSERIEASDLPNAAEIWGWTQLELAGLGQQGKLPFEKLTGEHDRLRQGITEWARDPASPNFPRFNDDHPSIPLYQPDSLPDSRI